MGRALYPGDRGGGRTGPADDGGVYRFESGAGRDGGGPPNQRRLAAEVLTRRVSHFTHGVIFGSRSWIDRWFESNRQIVQGRSRTERKRGAKSLGSASPARFVFPA